MRGTTTTSRARASARLSTARMQRQANTPPNGVHRGGRGLEIGEGGWRSGTGDRRVGGDRGLGTGERAGDQGSATGEWRLGACARREEATRFSVVGAGLPGRRGRERVPRARRWVVVGGRWAVGRGWWRVVGEPSRVAGGEWPVGGGRGRWAEGPAPPLRGRGSGRLSGRCVVGGGVVGSRAVTWSVGEWLALVLLRGGAGGFRALAWSVGEWSAFVLLRGRWGEWPALVSFGGRGPVAGENGPELFSGRQGVARTRLGNLRAAARPGLARPAYLRPHLAPDSLPPAPASASRPLALHLPRLARLFVPWPFLLGLAPSLSPHPQPPSAPSRSGRSPPP